METTGQPPTDSRDHDEKPRLIKRYANRKLYDTHDSRYVTLLQIAKLVRDGEHVTIIDNTTKEDLTNVTLAQIIYEEEKKGTDSNRGVASAGTLRSLIQHSGERLITSLRGGPMGKLIPRKDDDSGDVSVESDTGVDVDMASDPASEPDAPKEKDAKRGVFASSKDALDELQRLADDRMRGLLGHAITHVQQLQSEVKRLQGRIEELEEKLVKLGRRKGEEKPEDEDGSAPE